MSETQEISPVKRKISADLDDDGEWVASRAVIIKCQVASSEYIWNDVYYEKI